MNRLRAIGVILIAVGLIFFSYEKLIYKHEEKTVDLGPIQVTQEQEKSLPLSPVVGIVAIVGGVILLIWPNRKND